MSAPSSKLRHYDTYISSTVFPFCAVKVGYATEQTETKPLFWAERMCLPQSHEGDDDLLPQK